MRKLKYLLILIGACACFIAIDNVYAMQTRSSNISQVGTAEQIIFADNTPLFSEPFLTHQASYGYYLFSTLTSTYTSSYGYSFIASLTWTVPGSVLYGLDSIGYTVGYNNGYVNNMQFGISSDDYNPGWLSCASISDPSLSGDGVVFSAFTCNYDKKSISADKTYTLHFRFSTASKYMENNQVNLPRSMFLLSDYVQFFTDGDNAIVESIQENTEALNKQTQATEEQTETIKDSDTSGAESSANDFFGSFDSDDKTGLSDVITMPLNTIKNMTSSVCKPLSFPLPFVNKNMELPCMTSVYSKFGSILTIYQTITFGMIAYWVVVNIFATVRNFKDPDSDQIEVMSL